MRGSMTSSVFGDFEVSALTVKFVPPSARFAVNTPGALFVMFLVIPPAVRSVAPSLVGVKVCTRESAGSHCVQALGFLSVGVTRNSIVAPCATASAGKIPATRAASIDTPTILFVLHIVCSREGRSTVRHTTPRAVREPDHQGQSIRRIRWLHRLRIPRPFPVSHSCPVAENASESQMPPARRYTTGEL